MYFIKVKVDFEIHIIENSKKNNLLMDFVNFSKNYKKINLIGSNAFVIQKGFNETLSKIIEDSNN
jgi:hypothetical protein